MWRSNICRALGYLSGRTRTQTRRVDNVKKQYYRPLIDTHIKNCNPESSNPKRSLGGENTEDKGPNERQHRYKDAGHLDPPKPPFLETICLLGTAFTLGLNLRYSLGNKHYQQQCTADSSSRCKGDMLKCPILRHLLFRLAVTAPASKLVTNNALPEKQDTLSSKETDSTEQTKQATKESDCSEELSQMRKLVIEYSGLSEYYYGMELLDSNPSKAIECLKEACKMGCAKACFNLEGIGGVQKNYQKGISLISKAANDGFSKAQMAMGLLYGQQEEWNKAVHMFNAASTQGDLEAVYQLGLCYENGWGVPMDMEIAAEIYTQAAHKGHDKALHSLGEFYEKGLGGVERNTEIAASMYQMAVDAGSEQAKESLRALQEAEARKYQYIPSKVEVKQLAVDSEQLPKTSLRYSSSSPDLHKKNTVHHHKFAISQYLGLILPSIMNNRRTSQNSVSSGESSSNGTHIVAENCGCQGVISPVQEVLAAT